MVDAFVVYLTIYKGNLLPPFYIGSTTEEKIKNGYNGSVKSYMYKKIWNHEKTNNPHLFKTIILKKFNSRKKALLQEEKIHRQFSVHTNPLYINMAIANSKHVYMTKEICQKISTTKKGQKYPKRSTEHRKNLSESLKGRSISTETKNKISEAGKGRIPWNKGKKGIYSDEYIQKLSASHKGQKHSEEQKKKISESIKKHWQKRKQEALS